VVVVVLQI
jgi:hypothetical protein